MSCSNNNISINNNYAKSRFNEYSDIYTTIVDSISIYTDSSLTLFLNEYYSEWQIDSLVCINSKKDKLVTTINSTPGVCKECKMDDITKLLGKKINGKWYFFKGGGSLAVPRDMYGKDATHPLSFYELSKIARKEMLAGAVIEKNGKLIIDDKWVDRHFYNNGFAQRGWDEIKDRPKYDSVHWFYIMDKWKHKIDTNEYKPLQRKQQKN
ncbi:MAG: hypothetical protein V4667_08365 [Bacteroidota bacterium]